MLVRKIVFFTSHRLIWKPVLKEIEKAHHLMELAWRSLTKRQKQVIILYFYKNKTLQEIGRILGISFQAVQKCKEQALKKMRKVILG